MPLALSVRLPYLPINADPGVPVVPSLTLDTPVTVKVSPSGVSASLSLVSTLPDADGSPVTSPVPPSRTVSLPLVSLVAFGASLTIAAAAKVPLANWNCSTPLTRSVPSGPTRVVVPPDSVIV